MVAFSTCKFLQIRIMLSLNANNDLLFLCGSSYLDRSLHSLF